MTCSRIGCPAEAVSTVLGPTGREAVCFQHEREAVDRYGHADALPRPLYEYGGTVSQAVAALRGGTA